MKKRYTVLLTAYTVLYCLSPFAFAFAVAFAFAFCLRLYCLRQVMDHVTESLESAISAQRSMLRAVETIGLNEKVGNRLRRMIEYLQMAVVKVAGLAGLENKAQTMQNEFIRCVGDVPPTEFTQVRLEI